MRLLICVSLFFCTRFICSLLNSRTFREDSWEEGKNWWPPASSLSCSLCLPLFLSLCISMPWKFREAIVYQTEAWPIPAQKENVSSVICVILHSKVCRGKLATKQQNILSVEMRKKRTEQLWGQKWTETHAEVHHGFIFVWMRVLRHLRINGATFADSSWTLHLFVKRLSVLWCH